MKHLIIIIYLIFINITMGFAQEDSVNEIVVNISNLSSNKGQVLVGLYNTEKSFLGNGFKYFKTKIENNSCKVVFKDIPNGTYAISFYHDENENNKMDTNFIGIPKEDYGCSNNAKGFMGPPRWKDAKFQIHNETITQNIKL
ncbi:DUF2141 domain-containing protein [Sabulilitoribacter arenilitoris]|uniref:DUF2141 domain-containing protein n=1 Tax=Wocania arenilitoris TaxID=2044858 RepID=A0AAE3JME2_9FLAO|nr:DUF2141 domain-containing protein [Wocania arenilitoris]MCF7569244.1 DUF2141 domain-containing protein [Wocania arenilitoris]